jgi:WD40 repeat protein
VFHKSNPDDGTTDSEVRFVMIPTFWLVPEMLQTLESNSDIPANCNAMIRTTQPKPELCRIGNRRRLFRIIALLGLIFIPTMASAQTPSSGSDSSEPISYYRKIRPILQRRCSGCHFAGKQEGDLLVVSVADLLKGGTSGPAIIAGKPDDSPLIANISGEKPSMPLNADPLSADEVQRIRTWIEQGAADDTPASLGNPISATNPPAYRTPPVVTSMDYSPDGQWLAVSGYHEVLIHSVADPEAPPKRLIGRSQRIESVCFSPDGKVLAVAGGTPSLFGEIQLWKVEDGSLLHSVTMSHDTLFGLSFTADGKTVAFGGADNSVRAVDVESGSQKMRMDAHSDWVHGTTFSLKDDHVISVSRDRSMKLTILSSGQFVDNITSITPGALKGGLAAVQRHPTREEVLAVGSDGEPRLYKIFRTQARQIGDDFNLLKKYPVLPGRLCDIDFSTSGNLFVCGSSTAVGGAARVYFTEDPAKWVDLPGISGPCFAVAFRPDEKQVAISGFDGIVRLHHAETGQPERSFSAAPRGALTASSAPQ